MGYDRAGRRSAGVKVTPGGDGVLDGAPGRRAPVPLFRRRSPSSAGRVHQTRYRKEYRADGPPCAHSVRQYRHVVPSLAATSTVLGGRPCTTAASTLRPSSGPSMSSAAIVGPSEDGSIMVSAQR